MPELYKEKYKITSNRLKGYDYSSEGAYFIKICTAKHLCEFGTIENDEMILNKFGKIIESEWYKSEKIRNEILFGKFCIMPNHIHGIVFIDYPILVDNKSSKTPQTPGYKNNFGPQHKSISTFINQFKGACTRKITDAGNKLFIWQTNFNDRVIRNESEFIRIGNYIRSNPENWEDDMFYKSE